jgi:anti-sigma regulatory factor (Ser/Thr protein kinase)
VNPVLLESEDLAWFRDNLTGARLAAFRLAGRTGLSAERAGDVALAMAEATANLVEHAVDGTIVLRVVRTPQQAGIEFLAMDRGPGMAEVAEAAACGPDGRPAAPGTPGSGLGRIARLADTFDLHSLPGQGTVMLARFWPRAVPLRPSAALPESVVGGLARPISGEQECGDGWAARWTDAGTSARDSLPAPALALVPAPVAPGAEPGLLVMLCDGLGHGPLARVAAHTAIHAFRSGGGRTPEEVMGEIHRSLPGTRGAAVAVARIEPGRERVFFCGVGNISGAVVTPTAKSSLPGTAGHQIRTLRTFTLPLPAGSALVMHSDGLSERWIPGALPGLLQHSPTVIAGHLLRRAGKYHDDASVVVAKAPR